MTFFRRLRRLRRPVASCLLVCALFAFLHPQPSQAAYKIVYNVVKYGTKAGITLGRTGSFARAANEIRAPIAAFRALSTGEKAKYIAKEALFAAEIGMLWKFIKNHPGDAADIAGLGLDAWQALMDDKGMSNTARAVRDTLNPSSTSSPADAQNPGDKYKDANCGTYELVSSSELGYNCWDPNTLNQNSFTQCKGTESYYEVLDIKPPGTPGSPCAQYAIKTRKLNFKKVPDQPDPTSPTTLPDSLTPDQERRLLDKIGEYLDSQKEQMERELDDLLKKNLNDIDWPEFDNDAARKYLEEQRGQQLQDKIDDLQDEIERRKQERENCQQTGDCTNQCVDQCCEDSRLAGRLDQLKDRLDDLNQRQEDDAVNQYDPPTISEVELKQIDFQPVVDLKGELMTKFPFNMLQLIPSAFQLLTAEPAAPYWDANLGEMGGTHRVDFAVLNGLASFIRLVLTWLCYIGAVFCCLKIWSRF